MKEHRLLCAFGEIENDLIADAGEKRRPMAFLRWGAVVAAAILLTVGAALVPWGESDIPVAGNKPASSTDDAKSGDKRPVSDSDTTATTTANAALDSDASTTTVGIANTTNLGLATATDAGNIDGVTTTIKPTATKYIKDPELALVPKWEDKSIKQKYPEIPYGAATYSVYYTIDPKNVGEKLATVTATGQDPYTDTYHTTSVTLYRLADIAPQCAVAIRYDGDTAYYSAVATWYQPLTLGEFLDGLQLEKYGKFGDVSWDCFDEVYHYRTYSGVPKEVIFDLLLDDLTLPNVYDQQQYFYNSIDISVDLPILGLKYSVVMSLSEDGYLFTNLLGSGKTFSIGTDRVEAFKDYLQKNCESTVLAATTEAPAPTTETQPPVTGTTTAMPAQPPRTSGAYIPE